MSLANLRQRIDTREARVGVVGLGYVGLAVACAFARAGFAVRGIERRAERVAMINSGSSPMQGDEPGLAELLLQVTSMGMLQASASAETLRDCDVILIAVETPVEPTSKAPTYEALTAAARAVGKELRPGALVIVESTVAPGTLERVVRPGLEEASGLRVDADFYLGHCPERVMPGRLLHNLTTMSRVCGGHTPDTAEVMAALYRTIVSADLDTTDCITAELVKTTENAYRDVQIAFANEVALICEGLGADVWRVRELVNKSPSRTMHLPGAGVGGHCIPKDPWLLAYAARNTGIMARLLPAARTVNDSMPGHMADLAVEALSEHGRPIQGATVAILGFAYLENSDDVRNTPTEPVIARLREMGAHVRVHDPFVDGLQGDIFATICDADAAIIMVGHDCYKELDLAALREVLRLPVLVDGRRVFEPAAARQAGLTFRGIGRG
ncbi:MAG: nucleotide sugar dehydrogenase [Chloroflexales bacterium]|nr:nucleotide sugar dehydrogenase [Chloroflexales bacterium]